MFLFSQHSYGILSLLNEIYAIAGICIHLCNPWFKVVVRPYTYIEADGYS